MKLLIDVQCLRELDPHSGIERYSMELSKAVARNAGDHELWIATATETINTAEAIFGKWVPGKRILGLELPAPVAENTPASMARSRAAEYMREAFIAETTPDVVHLTSLVWDNAVTSIGACETSLKTTVTHYDLIPYLYPDRYLVAGWHRDWYWRKVHWLRNADLLLSISEYSKQEVTDTLGIREDRIAVVPGAAGSQFKPAQPNSDTEALPETQVRHRPSISALRQLQ